MPMSRTLFHLAHPTIFCDRPGFLKQKSQPLSVMQLGFCLVVLPGLEPGNAAPKTVVLPLHYRTILVN